MICFEWLVGISLAILVICGGLYYHRRCQMLVRLYFFYDETLIPYYLEKNQECIKHSDYAGALHALSQIMHVYERQVEISQNHYFRRFIRKPNTFSQTFLHDLKARCAILEVQLQTQHPSNLSLLKHCRLWLMELEKAQELNIDNRFSWKASSPQELKQSKSFKIRSEERILYVKMMLLYAKCFKLLWCWHFSLNDNEDLQRSVNFMARIFSANYACAKLLGLQNLLPEYNCDYDSLKDYCLTNPIASSSLCEGINPEQVPCTEHFPTEQELSGEQLHLKAETHVFYAPNEVFAFKPDHASSQLPDSQLTDSQLPESLLPDFQTSDSQLEKPQLMGYSWPESNLPNSHMLNSHVHGSTLPLNTPQPESTPFLVEVQAKSGSMEALQPVNAYNSGQGASLKSLKSESGQPLANAQSQYPSQTKALSLVQSTA